MPQEETFRTQEKQEARGQVCQGQRWAAGSAHQEEANSPPDAPDTADIVSSGTPKSAAVVTAPTLATTSGLDSATPEVYSFRG